MDLRCGLADRHQAASMVPQQALQRGEVVAFGPSSGDENKGIRKARETREADADLSGGNLDAIFTIFTRAIENGRKRPVLRIAILEDPSDEDSEVAGTVKISLAPAGGRNAGHLYVKLDDEYQGKVTPVEAVIPRTVYDGQRKDRLELLGDAPDDAKVGLVEDK